MTIQEDAFFTTSEKPGESNTVDSDNTALIFAGTLLSSQSPITPAPCKPQEQLHISVGQGAAAVSQYKSPCLGMQLKPHEGQKSP